MRHYVLWDEAQARLIQYEKETGRQTNFAAACSLLWNEGKSHCGEALPTVDFMDWDFTDLSAFHALLGSMPVDISFFLRSERGFSGPSDEMKESMNVLPIKIASHQEKRLHSHTSFEFLYVLKGAACVWTQGGAVHCAEGTMCILAPQFVHDVNAAPDSEVISLAFWPHSLEAVLRKLLAGENIIMRFFQKCFDPGGPGYVQLRLTPNRLAKRVVACIFAEGYSQERYARELRDGYIEMLITYALRECAEVPAGHERRSGKTGVPMASVLMYLQNHYRTTSLSEVARVFHYEPDYLSRQIKAATGRRYVDLILELKLNEAKRLLRGTDLSMEQIAERAGFHSAVHFSRLFREKEGLPPAAYRKQTVGKG